VQAVIQRYGTFLSALLLWAERLQTRRPIVGGLIYLIGLIVVILFILSFLGLR
jgi:hypothetical protein